jgi:DNA polymerase elongation subunit (family B)
MELKNLAEQKDFIRGREPKILYFDLEISPMLVWTYAAYEANALKVKKQPQIVSVAWQWEGEKKIHVRTLPEYKGYKPGISRLDDKELVKEFYDVMAEADVLIGHNIKRFDIKHAKARFIYHDLPVCKKWIIEDTLLMARKYFKFPKNNLDTLCKHFGIGSKSKITHASVIWGCIDGDMKAWKQMAQYNKQDIVLTRGLYKKLSPWHETHANLNVFKRQHEACPGCTSTNTHRQGFKFIKAGIRRQHQCQDCGKWWLGEFVARPPKKGQLETFTERVDQQNP